MLDKLIRGFEQGHGHKDYRRNGFGFEEHKDFVTRVESKGGHFDSQAHSDHRMRLPANHGRPPMSHMTVWDEEDEDSDVEYFESSQSHHTNALLHHQQPSHPNFMPPPLVAQPHHNGKMGNGWQGRHEDAYHSGHGMQQKHGRYEMQQHHGGHEMQGHHGMQQNHGRYEMQQHHGGHEMQGHHGMQQNHGRYEMQQHHGRYEMQQDHGRHEMQKHQDRFMIPQGPPSHVYMNPIHSSGDGRAVVVKTTEKLQVRGGHRKLGWGSKGL